MPNRKTRVLLADDHGMVRAGLRALLQSQPNVEVIAEAENGRTAVRLASELMPDVVIMDINMPDLDGIGATRQIRAGGAGPKVIGLSGHSDRCFTREMLKAGASAYVLKESAFSELANALASVVADKVYLSPSITAPLVEEMVSGRANGGSLSARDGDGAATQRRLTPREREVLQLMAEGKATKEIAATLELSVKTIETHRKNIMGKLNIFSVAELTKYAIREGLTALEA